MNYIRVAPAPGMDRRGTLRVLLGLLKASSGLVFSVKQGNGSDDALWELYCRFKFAVEAAEKAETEREQNAEPGDVLE